MTPLDNTKIPSAAFAITWDYRCPFARNAHEHVIAALEAGAPFDVTFVPFSLTQMHLEEGAASAFDDDARRPDLLAIEAGLVVRDKMPERFLAVHRALFALRHDEGGDLRDKGQLAKTLEAAGADPEYVFGEIESGWSLDTFRKEHDEAERDHSVWGVPTFIVHEKAAFVRIMTRPEGDAALARRTIDHVLDLFVDTPEINEFKHTAVPR
ncbi:MAG: DsbA family protein [Acidimicrobiales bacterium]